MYILNLNYLLPNQRLLGSTRACVPEGRDPWNSAGLTIFPMRFLNKAGVINGTRSIINSKAFHLQPNSLSSSIHSQSFNGRLSSHVLPSFAHVFTTICNEERQWQSKKPLRFKHLCQTWIIAGSRFSNPSDVSFSCLSHNKYLNNATVPTIKL